MWEERGAFDETRREPDTGLAWRLVAEVLREHHPDALVLIIQTLADAEQQARAALSANVCDTGAASALEATGSVVDFLGTLKALERYVDETGALHVRVPADLPPKP